jgi:hypothetical protein
MPMWQADQENLELGLMELVRIGSRAEDWSSRGARSQGVDQDLMEPVWIGAVVT